MIVSLRRNRIKGLEEANHVRNRGKEIQGVKLASTKALQEETAWHF